MILNSIEKRRVNLLTCEHPFIADAKHTNAALDKQRDTFVEAKGSVSSELTLQSQSTFLQEENK